MAKVKLTANKRGRLRTSLKLLVDIIGDMRVDKQQLRDELNDLIDEAKDIARKADFEKVVGNDYTGIFESFDRKETDWKALAMSYKPSKVKINRYTKKVPIYRLKTLLNNGD